MKKCIFLFIFCFQMIFSNNCYADDTQYGGQSIYRCEYMTYINNVPISTYDIAGYPAFDYVLIEDLTRYGFDVEWFEDEQTYRISRIPGKSPDTLTEEEYNKIISNKRGAYFGECYSDDSKNIYIGGYQVEFYYLPEYGHLIERKILGNLFGTIEDSTLSQDENSAYKITLTNDFPAVHSGLTDILYRTTVPINEEIAKKWAGVKDINKYKGNIDELYFGNWHKNYYFEKEYTIQTDEGEKAFKTTYIQLDVIDEIGLNYEMTEMGMEIPSGQIANKAYTIGLQDELYIRKETEYKSDGISFIDPNIEYVCLNGVDFKLTSDGKEIPQNGIFPTIVSIGKPIKYSQEKSYIYIDYELVKQLMGPNFKELMPHEPNPPTKQLKPENKVIRSQKVCPNRYVSVYFLPDLTQKIAFYGVNVMEEKYKEISFRNMVMHNDVWWNSKLVNIPYYLPRNISELYRNGLLRQQSETEYSEPWWSFMPAGIPLTIVDKTYYKFFEEKQVIAQSENNILNSETADFKIAIWGFIIATGGTLWFRRRNR